MRPHSRTLKKEPHIGMVKYSPAPARFSLAGIGCRHRERRLQKQVFFMRLTGIVHPNCIKVPLEGSDKQSAIFELVDLLAEQELATAPDALKEAVWEREQTRTTGIGHGVAIPHGKSEGIDQLRMAIGKPSDPLEFGAIDGQPVDLIFLLASPVDQTGSHIQALANISRMLTDENLRGTLKQVTSGRAMYDQLAYYEEKAAV